MQRKIACAEKKLRRFSEVDDMCVADNPGNCLTIRCIRTSRAVCEGLYGSLVLTALEKLCFFFFFGSEQFLLVSLHLQIFQL